MKNYTCDRCGLPMDTKNSIELDEIIYDICQDCEKIIKKNLGGKGERKVIEKNIFDKYRYIKNPNDIW